jgi:hypothetical protein
VILQTEGVWNVAIATSAMFAIDIELLFVCTRAAIAVLTIAAVVACLRRGYRSIFKDVDETPLTIRDMVPGWIRAALLVLFLLLAFLHIVAARTP